MESPEPSDNGWRRLPGWTVGLACLTCLVTGCDDEPPASRSQGERPTRPAPSASAEREPPEDTSSPDSADVEKIQLGSTVRGRIASPSSLDNLEFETDWYEVRTDIGEQIHYRLEATDEQGLRPMITVLLPAGRRSNWRALSVRRADRAESTLEGTVASGTDGPKLIAVDDVRNINRKKENAADAPGEYVGGEAFGYSLEVDEK